jgi:MSHA biogenesis protein MshQ
MRVDNAYGSSLLNLPVPVYAQYWNGSFFAKNTADSCTSVTVPATYSMSSTSTATLYCNGGVGLYGSLTGVAATSGAVSAGSSATLSSGNFALTLSKPTNSGGGYLDLALLVPDYLKYNVDNVDQSGATCTTTPDFYLHDDNPRARIRFGTRRNDSVIYLREVY